MKKLNVLVIMVVLCLIASFSLSCRSGRAQSGVDNDSPYIISTYPDNGDGSVPTTAWLHVTFSEDLDPGCITNRTYTARETMGSPVPGYVSYGNRSATFKPLQQLGENTSYTATISGSVRDISGNSLGSDYSWTFRTGISK